MGIQIFISYSRSSFAYARLLHNLLEARLNCKIFMDLTSIEPGEDFVRAIEQAERSSSVVVVLIAREWFLPDPVRGRSPVDDPENWVRREVAAALRQQTRVIPVLLGDVSMPAATDLPEDISSLARCHAIAIRDSEFDHDVERLIMVLEGEIGRNLLGRTRALDLTRFVADLVYYFPRFLKLIVMPKRVVRAFTANRQEELARAVAFLVISLLIFTAFSVPLFIDKERMIALLIVQFFMLGVLAFCSSAILQLSWHFVGGKAQFSRYLSINSYYWGVSSVLGICFVAAALGVIKTFDPEMLGLLRKAAAGDIGPFADADPSQSTPLRAAAWIVAIGNSLLLIWTYGFWGAYREINNASRLYSFVAFCASCILFLPVGIFFILIQEGLLNLLR